jgi:hypothetical protein
MGIFGPKREKVAEGWRRLRNGEIHNLYSAPNIIRIMKLRGNEMSGTGSTYWGADKHTENLNIHLWVLVKLVTTLLYGISSVVTLSRIERM